MTYRGLKWDKFNFVIHPTELQEVLKKADCFTAITNKRVEEDYQIKDKTSIIKKYANYYNKIISGQEWFTESDGKLEIHTSLTIDPKLIEYEPFQREEDGIIKTFKRAIQLEPVVNVTNFCLTINAKDKLSVSVYDLGKSNLGLQLNYPKEIYNFETKETIKTDKFSNFNLFVDLKKSIKKIGRKAKVERKGIIAKPNFWLTEKVIDDLNNNFKVKENLIEFIR